MKMKLAQRQFQSDSHYDVGERSIDDSDTNSGKNFFCFFHSRPVVENFRKSGTKIFEKVTKMVDRPAAKEFLSD